MTTAEARYDPMADFEVEVTTTAYRGDLEAQVYRPVGEGPFPGAIDVHGGGWNLGTRTSDETVDRALARSGVVVVAIDFRLAPAHAYPAQVEDLNFAIRWSKVHFADLGIDPLLPLGAVGFSSGGHTAILSAMRPRDALYAAGEIGGRDPIDASLDYVITLYPVIDPHARYIYAKDNDQDNLVKATEAYFLTEDVMREGNPQGALDRGESFEKPPILILQGTSDANVPMSIPERFVASYSAAGGSVQLERFEGAPHLFAAKPSPDTDRAVSLMKRFFASQIGAGVPHRTN
jgi:acetyl esterase